MSTPNLAIAHIAESQNGKELTANSAVDLLDMSMHGDLSIAMANVDYNLTGTQFLQSFLLIMTGALSAARNVIVPITSSGQTIKKTFAVKNATSDGSSPATGPFAVTFKTAAGTGIAVAPGKTAILRLDGTNVIRITADV